MYLVTVTPTKIVFESSLQGLQAAFTTLLFAVVKHSCSGSLDRRCSDYTTFYLYEYGKYNNLHFTSISSVTQK